MNKYKHLKTPIEIEEGEVNLTYGVPFLDGQKCKKHSPNRPFISLIKLKDGRFLSLKMSSQNSENFPDHKISVKAYGTSAVMSKNSFVATNYIYNLAPQDFIIKGFKLHPKDITILYNKIIKTYCINASHVSEEDAKLVFQRYMRHKSVSVGSVIKIPFLKEKLFVFEITDKGYRCIPMYQFEQEESQDMLRIMKAPSYMNYDEEIFVEKDEIFYIYQYSSDNEIIAMIHERITDLEKRKDALFSKKFIKP